MPGIEFDAASLREAACECLSAIWEWVMRLPPPLHVRVGLVLIAWSGNLLKETGQPGLLAVRIVGVACARTACHTRNCPFGNGLSQEDHGKLDNMHESAFMP